MKKQDLEDIFPIIAIENDCLVSRWGEITVAFEVSLPEVFTLHVGRDDAGNEIGDFVSLISRWEKAIQLLPTNCIIHKQDWFVETKYSLEHEANNFLDQASKRHFLGRPYLEHKCFLFITLSHKGRSKTSYAGSAFASGSVVPRAVLSREAQDIFLSKVSQFQSTLEGGADKDETSSLQLRRMKADELASSKQTSGLLERYMSLSLVDEVVPLTDIDFKADSMSVGPKQCKVFSLAEINDLPDWLHTHSRVSGLSTDVSQVSVGFAAPVGLLLDCNHIYNQYIFLEDRDVILPALEKKVSGLKSLSAFARVNAINAQLLTDFITYAEERHLAPVRIHCNLLAWTEKPGELTDLRNKVGTALSQMGVKPREVSQDAGFFFMAGLPGAAGDLPREETFLQFVPHGVCLFNHETNYPTTQFNGLGAKVTDRMTGKPLWLDMSVQPKKMGWIDNLNKFFIGPSGSGKSFLVNHFLRAYYNQLSHIVVIDVGHSYLPICEMLGGKYLTYAEGNPLHFNPFAIEGRKKPDEEKREGLLSMLQTLWKFESEEMTMSQRNALSTSITAYYDYLEENAAVFPSMNTYYAFLDKNFRETMGKKASEYFDLDNLLFNLEPYVTGGQYEFLLNSRENMDLLNERFIVFELDNIKDHPILFPIVTIMIMDTYVAKMRKLDERVRKIILIEEAWKALMNKRMAGNIEYLYRTCRKFNGEAWTVTQNLEDIADNPLIKTIIINNADTKILLDQRKYEKKFSFVQDLLALSDSEKALVLSLNKDLAPDRRYKEFFVSFGKKAGVYGLEVCAEEYWAYTTDPTEKSIRKDQVARRKGDFAWAIADLVSAGK